MATVKNYEDLMIDLVTIMECTMVIWMLCEYILRVWATGCRSRYQGIKGRLKYIRKPLCIIDVLLILANVTLLIIGVSDTALIFASLNGLRFFQILRLVRTDRRGGTWKLLGSVVWAHRQELITTLYIGILGLLFASFFVYLAEKSSQPEFRSFPEALWWGVTTLCTVGYGDVVPKTWAGKLIASLSAILGISFFALPAGIMGSGFALKVQQQLRQKHLIRRRVPAATLIQCLWRCYAADENSMSMATWKIHLRPCPSPPMDRQWNKSTSFVSRLSTRRRDRYQPPTPQAHSPVIQRPVTRKLATSAEEGDIPEALHRSHLSLATGIVDQRADHPPVRKENSTSSMSWKESEEDFDGTSKVTQLTRQHKRAIRALRKIRYFVARRKFKEALRPYDVKDVMEQYAAGHADMLCRIKNLQCRLDQILGKQGSKSKDVYDSKQSLASRVVNVERQVEDIETKMDVLIDMYKEDRRMLLDQQRQILAVVSGSDSNADRGIPQALNLVPTKPRPILVDRTYPSEPCTPTPGANPEKPMFRHSSDVSQRIKKRVTYRCLSYGDSDSKKVSERRSVSVHEPPWEAARRERNDSFISKRNDSASSFPDTYSPSSVESDKTSEDLFDGYSDDTNHNHSDKHSEDGSQKGHLLDADCNSTSTKPNAFKYDSHKNTYVQPDTQKV